MKDINMEPNRFNIAEKTFIYLLDQGFTFGSTNVNGTHTPCYKWKYEETMGEFKKRNIEVCILSNSKIVVKYGVTEVKTKEFELEENEPFDTMFNRVVDFKNEIICSNTTF